MAVRLAASSSVQLVRNSLRRARRAGLTGRASRDRPRHHDAVGSSLPTPSHEACFGCLRTGLDRDQALLRHGRQPAVGHRDHAAGECQDRAAAHREEVRQLDGRCDATSVATRCSRRAWAVRVPRGRLLRAVHRHTAVRAGRDAAGVRRLFGDDSGTGRFWATSSAGCWPAPLWRSTARSTWCAPTCRSTRSRSPRADEHGADRAPLLLVRRLPRDGAGRQNARRRRLYMGLGFKIAHIGGTGVLNAALILRVQAHPRRRPRSCSSGGAGRCAVPFQRQHVVVVQTEVAQPPVIRVRDDRACILLHAHDNVLSCSELLSARLCCCPAARLAPLPASPRWAADGRGQCDRSPRARQEDGLRDPGTRTAASCRRCSRRRARSKPPSADAPSRPCCGRHGCASAELGNMRPAGARAAAGRTRGNAAHGGAERGVRHVLEAASRGAVEPAEAVAAHPDTGDVAFDQGGGAFCTGPSVPTPTSTVWWVPRRGDGRVRSAARGERRRRPAAGRRRAARRRASRRRRRRRRRGGGARRVLDAARPRPSRRPPTATPGWWWWRARARHAAGWPARWCSSSSATDGPCRAARPRRRRRRGGGGGTRAAALSLHPALCDGPLSAERPHADVARRGAGRARAAARGGGRRPRWRRVAGG